MLASLHFKSELEVFKAAVAWIESNNEERNQYADILLKVHLPLLSDNVKDYIRSKKLFIKELVGCRVILGILENILLNILQERHVG